MTLDEFLDNVCQRPLPQSKIAQVRTLAKELAEGIDKGVWGPRIQTSASEYSHKVGKYLKMRWNVDNYGELFELLQISGYIKYIPRSNSTYQIEQRSIDLLEESEPSTIFISYRRKESSAFALLVLKYLKEAGLEPFLDMSLVPGEDFHNKLRERIETQDYFILLLGKTSLESEWVIQEIRWAQEKGLDIIPIWQPGFAFNEKDWAALSPEISHKLATTHTIRILEENPTAYHTAMVELLNKFGITP